MSAAKAPEGLLASLSWRGVGIVVLCCVALSAWTWSGTLLYARVVSAEEHLEYFLSLLQRNLLTYVTIYLVVAIADRLPLQGPRRRFALGAALLAAVLLSVQLRCAASPDQLFYVYSSTVIPYCTAFPTWRTYLDFPGTVFTPLAFGAMAMVLVFGRRRDGELVAALHKARTARLASHRNRIESDIEAMQARVDPDALFGRLREIRDRYDASPMQGEAMLDDLIQGLRNAARRAVPAA